MKLTKQGEYALRSLISLGVAHELGREVVPVSELANAERLPLKFAERILSTLREAGYVTALRGKAGGYRLNKPTDEIVIGEVVRLIDGRLAPIGCASEANYEPCSCPDEAHCGLRMLMIDVRNAIAGILDRYTLSDIVFVHMKKLLRDGIQSPFARSDTPPPSKLMKRGRSARSRSPADPRDGFLALLIDAESKEPSKDPRS